MRRATVFPYSYPRTTPIPSLDDHLADRMSRLRSAVGAIAEADLVDPDRRLAAGAVLWDRFNCAALVLGEAAMDPTTGTEQVLVTDPRRLGLSQTPRRINVDVHTVRIPVSGNPSLLNYWPPDAHAAEPSERLVYDGVNECVRIPALVDPGNPTDRSAAVFLREQESLIRKLAAATNRRVEDWNDELAAAIEKGLDRHSSTLARRRETQRSLGYDVIEIPDSRTPDAGAPMSGVLDSPRELSPEGRAPGPIERSAQLMSDDHPKALVSWAHIDPGWTPEQTQERQDAVLAVANALRDNGIDADLDLFHHNKTTDWTRFGPARVAEADRIVLGVISEAWRTAWEGGGDPTKGAGAAAEADALRSAFAKNRDTFLARLRLIVLPGQNDDEVPNGLHGVPRYWITSYDRDGMADLLRDLLDNPRFPPAPLGPRPSLDPEPSPAPGPASPPTATREAPYTWDPLDEEVYVSWRHDTSAFGNEEAALTLHIIDLDGRRISARQMPDLEARAKAHLRSSGLAPDDLPIRTLPDAHGLTIAIDAPPPAHGTISRGQVKGVRIRYDGQLATWKTLPKDSMGYVVDVAAVESDIADLIGLAAFVVGPGPRRLAVAGEVGPPTLITEGTLDSLGRDRATMLKTGKGPLQVPPDEAVTVQDLAAGAADIAADYAPVLHRAWVNF